jgi:septal ring factor EnvC (AmiA/AmiB activator)
MKKKQEVSPRKGTTAWYQDEIKKLNQQLSDKQDELTKANWDKTAKQNKIDSLNSTISALEIREILLTEKVAKQSMNLAMCGIMLVGGTIALIAVLIHFAL